jgi:5S rRNA maturation endonuclease (ribonuclease M5)
LKIPKETKIYIGTDPDEKGKEYASTIQLQLGDRISYRIPLEDLTGDTDA